MPRTDAGSSPFEPVNSVSSPNDPLTASMEAELAQAMTIVLDSASHAIFFSQQRDTLVSAIRNFVSTIR
jgi:hypothetical protein